MSEFMWMLRIKATYFHLFHKIVNKTSLFPPCEFLGIRTIHYTAAMPKRQHSIEKDELLIAEVEKHPFLYEKHKSYNHTMRQEGWEKIGDILGISDLDAKLRWINIRDCFSRCLKKKKADPRGDSSYRYHYKYANQLEFMLPHLAHGESSVTEDGDQHFKDDGEGSEVDDDYPHPTQILSATPVPYHQVPDKRRKLPDQEEKETMGYLFSNNSAPREDALDTFFKSICSTVRTLPPIAQAQLRFQITELVFKSEMNYLTNDNENDIGLQV